MTSRQESISRRGSRATLRVTRWSPVSGDLEAPRFWWGQVGRKFCREDADLEMLRPGKEQIGDQGPGRHGRRPRRDDPMDALRAQMGAKRADQPDPLGKVELVVRP